MKTTKVRLVTYADLLKQLPIGWEWDEMPTYQLAHVRLQMIPPYRCIACNWQSSRVAIGWGKTKYESVVDLLKKLANPANPQRTPSFAKMRTKSPKNDPTLQFRVHCQPDLPPGYYFVKSPYRLTKADRWYQEVNGPGGRRRGMGETPEQAILSAVRVAQAHYHGWPLRVSQWAKPTPTTQDNPTSLKQPTPNTGLTPLQYLAGCALASFDLSWSTTFHNNSIDMIVENVLNIAKALCEATTTTPVVIDTPPNFALSQTMRTEVARAMVGKALLSKPTGKRRRTGKRAE